MPRADGAVEPQPEWDVELRAACGRYVSEVEDVLPGPAEALQQALHLTLRRLVVPRPEDVVPPGHERGIDHDLAVHGVEGLYVSCLGRRDLAVRRDALRPRY